jgi:hypothetical protein
MITPARLEVPERGAREVEVGVDVRPERLVPLGVVDLVERRLVLLVRGVVDEDVEPAELAHGALHRRGAERGVLDVAGDAQEAAPGALDVRAHLVGVGLLLGEVDDGHVGALAGVEHGHRAADPRVAAGDERGEPGELAGGLVRGGLELRLEREVALEAGLLEVLRRHLVGVLLDARLRGGRGVLRVAAGGHGRGGGAVRSAPRRPGRRRARGGARQGPCRRRAAIGSAKTKSALPPARRRSSSARTPPATRPTPTPPPRTAGR